MRIASILDMHLLLDMIDDGDANRILGIQSRLHSSEYASLLNEEGTACLFGDPVDRGKWSIHILSVPAARGKALWDFSLQAMLWMIFHRNMEYALFFTKRYDKRMKRFLAYYGLSPATNIGEAEALYIVGRDAIIDFAAQQRLGG